jgi:hypothetical protein
MRPGAGATAARPAATSSNGTARGLIERGQLEQVVGDFLKRQPRSEPNALAEHLLVALPPWLPQANASDDWQSSVWEHAETAPIL